MTGGALLVAAGAAGALLLVLLGWWLRGELGVDDPVFTFADVGRDGGEPVPSTDATHGPTATWVVPDDGPEYPAAAERRTTAERLRASVYEPERVAAAVAGCWTPDYSRLFRSGATGKVLHRYGCVHLVRPVAVDDAEQAQLRKCRACCGEAT